MVLKSKKITEIIEKSESKLVPLPYSFAQIKEEFGYHGIDVIELDERYYEYDEFANEHYIRLTVFVKGANRKYSTPVNLPFADVLEIMLKDNTIYSYDVNVKDGYVTTATDHPPGLVSIEFGEFWSNMLVDDSDLKKGLEYYLKNL